MEHEQDIQEQEVHLKDYLRVLQRRKYIILLIFIISMPLIVIRAFSGDPMYGATAKLLIERDTTPSFITDARMIHNPGFLTTQTQVIKSRKVARQVVEKLNLDETYRRYLPELEPDLSLFDKVINWAQKLVAVSVRLAGLGDEESRSDTELTEAEEKEQRIQALVKMISEGITVESDRDGGNVVKVSFMSSNPDLAADIVNTVAAAYKGFLLEMRTESTAETLEWLKDKAAMQQEKLQASERQLQQYKKEQDIYTVDDEEAMYPQRIAELSRRLTRAQAEVGELESLYQEINRISLSEALNLPAVTESETVRDLRRKVIEQDQEIERLSKSIGEKHPRMIRARDDLEALRQKLNQEIRGVIQSIKNKYELAREKADSIEALLEENKQKASLMSDKLIQYEILKRDVDVNSLLYDRMLRRIKEFDVTDASQPIDVWVVEEATVPEYPLNKRPKRTLMLGLVMSLMLGVGLAFFLEYLDNTVKTVEDAEARLGLPVLGMVPLLKDSDSPIEHIVRDSPRSVIAENYKSLRTAVLLSSPDDAPRSLLISSMNPSTGKTVTAVNLAVTFAQSERRVLLIDADMRRPRIHNIFGMDNENGLSTLLAGQSEMVIQESTEIPFLHVLTSGPVPPNPSELLISSRLESTLSELREKYDYVIIDSPPMMNVTDANLISRVVDQTLLVIRSGVSTYESLRRGEKMLATIKARTLGYIINAVDNKKEGSYYYNQYYHGYYAD